MEHYQSMPGHQRFHLIERICVMMAYKNSANRGKDVRESSFCSHQTFCTDFCGGKVDWNEIPAINEKVATSGLPTSFCMCPAYIPSLSSMLEYQV